MGLLEECHIPFIFLHELDSRELVTGKYFLKKDDQTIARFLNIFMRQLCYKE